MLGKSGTGMGTGALQLGSAASKTNLGYYNDKKCCTEVIYSSSDQDLNSREDEDIAGLSGDRRGVRARPGSQHPFPGA